jgi:hypothetical protein
VHIRRSQKRVSQKGMLRQPIQILVVSAGPGVVKAIVAEQRKRRIVRVAIGAARLACEQSLSPPLGPFRAFSSPCRKRSKGASVKRRVRSNAASAWAGVSPVNRAGVNLPERLDEFRNRRELFQPISTGFRIGNVACSSSVAARPSLNIHW